MSGTEIRTVRLTAYVGERALFAFASRLLVATTHFTRLGRDPAQTLESLGPPPADAHGVLLRSHPVEDPLPRLARVGDHLRYVPQQYERHYVELTGTFEDYLQRFSSKSRSTLKRKVRKFAKHSGGDLEWRQYRTAEELEEFYPLARQVSAKTYQERLLDAGLPDTEEFRQRMRTEESRGYLLMHAARPVAYIYSPCDDGIMSYTFVGHDPEYNSFSPGTVLQYKVLEDLFSTNGVKLFDFTEGEGPHKSFFSTHSVLCADIYYFRRSLRNSCVVRIHAAVDAFSRALGALLDRLGLKAKLKRWFRRNS